MVDWNVSCWSINLLKSLASLWTNNVKWIQEVLVHGIFNKTGMDFFEVWGIVVYSKHLKVYFYKLFAIHKREHGCIIILFQEALQNPFCIYGHKILLNLEVYRTQRKMEVVIFFLDYRSSSYYRIVKQFFIVIMCLYHDSFPVLKWLLPICVEAKLSNFVLVRWNNYKIWLYHFIYHWQIVGNWVTTFFFIEQMGNWVTIFFFCCIERLKF